MANTTDDRRALLRLKPPSAELAAFQTDPFSARSLLSGFLLDVVNPENPTLRRSRSEDPYYGYPYGLLDEMLDKDAHLAALVELRKQAVLDCDLAITPADESPRAAELADFSRWALTRIGTEDGQDWRSVTAALLDSVPYGFRVCEYLWGTASHGGREYWVPDSLVPRRHRRFTFGDRGELLLIGLDMKPRPVPPYKFVVARLYPAADSPWGDPLLARAYHLWRFKKAVLAYWISYCEKYGQPLPVGKLTEEFTGNADELDAFEEALAGIQQEGYIRLGRGQEVDVIEFGRADSRDLYQGFATWADRQLSKLWVGATMVMEETEHGTQSMSSVLENRFLSKVRSDAHAVSRVWSMSILKTIVELNFGPEAAKLTPQLELDVKDEADLELETQIDAFLLDSGIPLSKAELYARYHREPPAEDAPDDALEKQQPAPLQPLPQLPGPEDMQAFGESEAGFESQALARDADHDRETVVADNDMRQALAAGFEELLAGIRERLSQAATLRELAAEPPADFDPDPLVAPLAALYKLAWLRGALKNAPNLGFSGIPGRRQFGEIDRLKYEERALPETEEFDSLKWAIRRVVELNILTREEFDQLDGWARSLAYTAAGQTVDTLARSARELVLDSIEDGLSLSQAIERVRPYWDPLPQALMPGRDTAFLTEAHLENVVRTNTMRAYNQGWNDIAYTAGMAVKRPAAEFVSILDSRTTDTCRALDGRILTRDAVAEATPPLHYQCRSMLIWLSERDLEKRPASKMLTRDRLLELPEKELPLPGFGKYVPLFGGSGK